MKKSLVLAVLGLSAAAVSSFGQGSVAFNTYNANSNSGLETTFGLNGTYGGVTGSVGAGIGTAFTAELLWSSTAINSSATVGAVAAGASELAGGWNLGVTAQFFPVGTALGYVKGNNLNLTSAQIASGGTVYLEVVAFTGGAYATAGQWSGHSASFTATVASGVTAPDASQMNNMPLWSVYNVTSAPEPSSLALAGLGGFGMLMAFRRKQA